MTYRLRSLAFGCAVAALGTVLPAAAPHAQESVPGMLRCFEGGVETATIGPIFRVWTAQDEAEAPAPGADGCHWQPMARIEMRGAAPPQQAMVSGGRRIQMPRPAESDSQNEAAAMAAMGGDVVDVPTAPAAPPPLPPGQMAGRVGGAIGANGLPLGGGAESAEASSDIVIVPPVADRSARLPIDLSVAAKLTAEAIAVEAVPLPEPERTTAQTVAAGLPEGAGEDLSLELDVALTDPLPRKVAPMIAEASRTNPHPPRVAPVAVAVAPGPRQPLRPDPHPDRPVGPALLAAIDLPTVEGHRPLAMPVALAEALTVDLPDIPAATEPVAQPPVAVAAAEPRPRLNPHAGIAIPQISEPPVVASATTDVYRPNPHADIAIPQVPAPPVVLASTTPEGHRPNPHAPLPDGWGTAPQDALLFADADLPLRGGPALTRWAATARGAAAPDLKPVALPGWDGPAPRIAVARGEAVRPPLPPEAPAAPETLVAEATAAEDRLKVQTARRADPETDAAEVPVEAAATPAVERQVVEVASSPAVVPEETPPVAETEDGARLAEAMTAAAGADEPVLEPMPTVQRQVVEVATSSAVVPEETTPAADTGDGAQLAEAATAPDNGDAPATEPAVAGDDGWWLQLASLTSPAGAMREWSRRQSVTGDLLSALEPTVVRADIPDRGVYYRLWLGPFDDAREASRLCERIKRYGEACFIHRMDGQPVPREEVASLPR